MKTRELLERIAACGKSYFSSKDIQKFFKGSCNELRVTLHRLVKQKRLAKILRGFYAFDLARVDWEGFACELVRPSYISLEYALHRHGLTDQVPSAITLVTLVKSAAYQFPALRVEYTKIQPKYFFGFQVENNVHMASKEKALWDELYLVSRGKRLFPLESLDRSKINLKNCRRLAERFPLPTQKLAQKYILKN